MWGVPESGGIMRPPLPPKNRPGVVQLAITCMASNCCSVWQAPWLGAEQGRSLPVPSRAATQCKAAACFGQSDGAPPLGDTSACLRPVLQLSPGAVDCDYVTRTNTTGGARGACGGSSEPWAGQDKAGTTSKGASWKACASDGDTAGSAARCWASHCESSRPFPPAPLQAQLPRIASRRPKAASCWCPSPPSSPAGRASDVWGHVAKRRLR